MTQLIVLYIINLGDFMDEIVFVTHNKGKALAASKYFHNMMITTYDYELNEPRSDDITLIAKSKVMEAYSIVHKPCIALDAAFYINALGGFPKTFVNFVLDTIGIDGILKLMEEKSDRTCFFRECLAYYDGESIHYFYGETYGELSYKKHIDNNDYKWSYLWYIFIPQGFNKTLAEMGKEELENRKTIDKSTSAMEEFANWYNEKNKIKTKKLY